MLLPLLVQNLGSATGSGDLDFTVVEIVRDYRLEGAAIIIDGNLVGFTRAIGVFRQNGVATGSHTLEISLDGYNPLLGNFSITAGATLTEQFQLTPFVNQFLKRDPPRSPSMNFRRSARIPRNS
jgi:PEGA domain